MQEDHFLNCKFVHSLNLKYIGFICFRSHLLNGSMFMKWLEENQTIQLYNEMKIPLFNNAFYKEMHGLYIKDIHMPFNIRW